MKGIRDDFPDFLGPMLVKELRQGMRTRTFVTCFLAIQGVMILLFSLCALDYGSRPDNYNINDLNLMYWAVCQFLLLLVMPLRGIVALSSEEKAKTLELLFLTRLTAWRIVWGKWTSLMFQSILFALAMLPYGMVRYFFGDVNLLDDLTTMVWILWLNGLLTALAVGFSGFSWFIKGIILVVWVLSGLSGLQIVFTAAYVMRSVAGSSALTMGWGGWLLLFLDSAVLGVYLLQMAASLIAPDAENHLPLKRGLALLLLLLDALLCFIGASRELILMQFTLASMVTVFCCVEGLCSRRPVMRAHIEAMARWGRPVLWLGRVFYPGWASGAAFVFLSSFLLVMLLKLIGGWDPDDWLRATSLIFYGTTALLTPLLLFSLLMKSWRQAPVPFFIVQIGLGIVTMFIFVASHITRDRLLLKAMLPFPLPSFWIVLSDTLRGTEPILFHYGSVAVLAAFILFYFLGSRSEWKKIAAMESTLPRRGGVAPGLPEGAR